MLVLALGIGATTAVFSVSEALLLRPLPHPDGDRLVALQSVRRLGDFPSTRAAAGTLARDAWRRLFDADESLVGGTIDLHVRDLSRVGPTRFTVLGVAAAPERFRPIEADFEVTQAVVQRRQELAVRSALGAGPARVVALAMRTALQPAAIGIAVGAVGAAGLDARAVRYAVRGGCLRRGDMGGRGTRHPRGLRDRRLPSRAPCGAHRSHDDAAGRVVAAQESAP